MNAIASKVGISRREVKYRVQFADKFGDEAALGNAVAQWPSWHAMVNVGIPTPREHTRPRLWMTPDLDSAALPG
jgi:hypothetical protein